MSTRSTLIYWDKVHGGYFHGYRDMYLENGQFGINLIVDDYECVSLPDKKSVTLVMKDTYFDEVALAWVNQRKLKTKHKNSEVEEP